MKFNYSQPTEIKFKSGNINILADIVKRFGNKIVLVGPILNENIKAMFDKTEKVLKDNNIEFISFYEIESNPSSKTVDKLHKIIKENKVDAIVGLGGGSVMDSSKIVGLTSELEYIDWEYMYKKYDDFTTHYEKISNRKLPVICIPTTSGTGSQCTQASVITSETGMKLTVFHQDNFPNVTIIDPELTLTLPNFITASTAFDAFTHSFESFLRNEGDVISEMMSLKAIKNIAETLPKVLRENKLEYREKLCLSDTFGGIALSNCGACLPHPLSEVIGSFVKNLAHGQALAMVYPTFLKYTHYKYTKKFAEICRIFDESYKNKSDEIASANFYLVLERFLIENDLEFKLSDYTKDENVIKEIKEFGLWDVLPLEETPIIHKIINEICEK